MTKRAAWKVRRRWATGDIRYRTPTLTTALRLSEQRWAAVGDRWERERAARREAEMLARHQAAVGAIDDFLAHR